MGNLVGDEETLVLDILHFQSVQDRLLEHYHDLEKLDYNWVTLMLQGSQNYDLDYEDSDVDTKAILLPSFKDIVLNHKPISTTYIRDNNEHIDLKDIRLMFQCYKKQNLNFVETLFTNWRVVNPKYSQEWKKLVDAKEEIARYNPYTAVKSMKGIAMEKYHALCHPYPTAAAEIEKFGYSSKQLHHLLRVKDFLIKYINGENYIKCMHPEGENKEAMLNIKKYPGLLTLEEAQFLADRTIYKIAKMAADFCEKTSNESNKEIDILFEEILTNIMRISLREEIL